MEAFEKGGVFFNAIVKLFVIFDFGIGNQLKDNLYLEGHLEELSFIFLQPEHVDQNQENNEED